MKDVIIVGAGISGCVLAWHWHKKGKTVQIIANDLPKASRVAAGVYNPLVLKRFTPIWKAKEQLNLVQEFYSHIELETKTTLLHPITIYRRLHNESEVKTWSRKALRADLEDFMQPEVSTDNIKGIDSPFGYGKVNDTGWCDTNTFVDATLAYFEKLSSVSIETLKFENLTIHKNKVTYNKIQASHIIFAEGTNINVNPYYNHLPLQGNKGELLTIKIPNFKLDQIIKSSVFLMPYRADLFWVGATYDRDDHTLEPTEKAKDYLISRLESFLKVPYTIIEHKHGIRPTTEDRRPFIGTNDPMKKHYVFNGMGSRAVLLAPFAAEALFNNMYHNKPLDPEMDIIRFKS